MPNIRASLDSDSGKNMAASIGSISSSPGGWRPSRSAPRRLAPHQGPATQTPRRRPRPKLAAGDLLGWYQAYRDDRRDRYLPRDALLMAEELCCVNPTRTCAEATIDFAEVL